MEIKNIIEGTHNKQQFRYENGKIHMFGMLWDKRDIETLKEVAYLLGVQGYKIKEPIGIRTRHTKDMFGNTITVEEKQYDDNGD